MIITVISVRMVQMPIDQIVRMIPMSYLLMAAIQSVDVIGSV